MNKAVTFNADFFRDLSIIAQDDSLMSRAIKYVKKLAAEKQADDVTLMTEDAFFAKVERAEEQYRQGQGIRFNNREKMNAWLNSLRR